MEQQRSVSVSPAQTALLSMGRKWFCIFFIVFPKSNFEINQPCQKFPCSWAGAHPLQEPSPRGGGSRGPTAPLPSPGTCRQTHCFLTLPAPQRRKRLCGRACPSKEGWHWHESDTRNAVRLQSYLHSLHLLHRGSLHFKLGRTTHAVSSCSALLFLLPSL